MESSVAVQDTWLRAFHPRPTPEMDLVCLPHAGGAASFYFGLSERLPDSVQLRSVQYPGRQDRRRDAPVESVHQLAAQILDALDVPGDRPLAVFGHSMGATVGFELIRMMERERGVSPIVFFASGRPAPSRHHSKDIHLLDDKGIVAELKRINGTDSRVLDDPELLEFVMPAIRADYRAAETYRYQPGPKLRCPVVALAGDSDPNVTVADAAKWEDHTEASCTLRVLPGGHFFPDEQRDLVATIVADTLRAM
ncbi:thioesterase II family protein [Kibdelosporangium aridum]|uniref:thioesterase II family protein n=1 Tax=Kibdelosporangium aridum TaxID=2030 RepID=UPI0005269799